MKQNQNQENTLKIMELNASLKHANRPRPLREVAMRGIVQRWMYEITNLHNSINNKKIIKSFNCKSCKQENENDENERLTRRGWSPTMLVEKRAWNWGEKGWDWCVTAQIKKWRVWEKENMKADRNKWRERERMGLYLVLWKWVCGTRDEGFCWWDFEATSELEIWQRHSASRKCFLTTLKPLLGFYVSIFVLLYTHTHTCI